MGSKFYLEQEIFVEILIRTTLETLDTFKVASKEYNELASESWFIEKYARKTKNIIGYIVQTLERFTCSYNFVSITPSLEVPGISMECFRDGMMILASSKQGILCCRKYADRAYHYYVCKPSTGQSVELPSPRGRDTFLEHIALQILKSNPFEYKIIRFSYARFAPPGNTSLICEIFHSKIWTWRQLEDLVMEQDTIFSNQPPVCIGGIVYLLTNRNTFLAFDSKTETHREFASPIAAIEDDKNYSKGRIVDYKGKLGFTCEYKFDEVWLWGVEDNRDYRWEIKRVVRIDKENNRLIGCSLADMALMIGYSYQVSGSHYYKDIFLFRSDWEPVDLEDGCMLSGLEELITAS
nr:F-box protein At5g49610-like [Ipomoea trifida]